jgi:Ca-activated chloride channel homolog
MRAYVWGSAVALVFLCVAVFAITPAASAQSSSTSNTQNSQTANAPPAGAENRPTPGSEPQTQEPSSDDQGNVFVFKKQVEEVVLHASVFDDQRRPVPNLDRSAFSVFEDGQPQIITSFRRQDVPVAMGIVIDNSGSMRDKREKVNDAVLNLIRASNPEDEIFVVNFSQEPYLDQDFTSDVKLLQTALHQVSSRGSTALYDAIVASALHLENNPHRLNKMVLLVITDGQDNMSQETLDEALHRLQKPDGPVLYSIGLLGSGLQQSGHDALLRLAAGTGGVAYFPETVGEVDDITRTIAHDIRSQYVIAYRPRNQNAKPGYESIRVQAHAAGYGPLTVRTKSGYFAGQPGQPPQ